MSESLKYQHLKFKIHGKSDKDVEAMLKPYEERYAQIRKLKKKPSAYIPVMRYLFYLYDPNTDLNRDFVRLEDRKSEAGRLSGLNLLKDEEYRENVYASTQGDVLDVIHLLLSEIYHNIDYREWHTLHEELDEYTEARWDKIEATKRKKGKDGEELIETSGHTKSSMEAMNLKSKLREDCARIRELLGQLTPKIFGDHKDIEELAYKSRYTNPESFSKALQQVL